MHSFHFSLYFGLLSSTFFSNKNRFLTCKYTAKAWTVCWTVTKQNILNHAGLNIISTEAQKAINTKRQTTGTQPLVQTAAACSIVR